MRLLDAFCGAGGAAMGYSRAGFTEIVGVDIKPQPRYPFTFVLGDSLEYIKAHGHEFDAIHASPPCQAYSSISRQDREYDDLYVPTRRAVSAIGAPWIVENVIGAPYRYGVVLCGSMFGLPIRRHRNFETSWLILQPACDHSGPRPYTITGNAHVAESTGTWESKHTKQPSKSIARAAMGIDWMDWRELTQAIPPAYTEFIGRQLLRALRP